ncbi:MAG: hypothetical protein FWD76_01760 [Firmicutes bacterium]|nr:hypothetical protein [Bacillota bacterium]
MFEQTKYRMDYYGECKLWPAQDFPFRIKSYFNTGNLWIRTDESDFEQSVQKIQESENEIDAVFFKDSDFEHSQVGAAWIKKPQNGKLYYYIMWAQSKVGEYYLDACVQRVEVGDNATVYFYLAPTFAYDYQNREGLPPNGYRIQMSWEELVKFYKDTGQSNFEIDTVGKTIRFACEYGRGMGGQVGTVVIHFVESETGSYVFVTQAK